MRPIIIIIILLQYALADDYYCVDYINASVLYGYDCRTSTFQWYSCAVDMCPLECDVCVNGETYMVGCGGISPGECKACTVCGPGMGVQFGCFSFFGGGTVSTDATCEPCGHGTYKSAEGNDYCKICPPGMYSDAGATVCTLCPSGTYQVGEPGYSRDIQCIPCETSCAGGYIKVNCTGAVSGCAVCSQCGPGMIKIGGCFIVGAISVDTICDVCGAGTYSDGAHNVECKTCPTGTYQTNTAASACLPCGLCNNGYYPLGCGSNTAGGCLRCTNTLVLLL
jgi:hypothetical protein